MLSTRIERLVTVDVDMSYRKSICKALRKFSVRGHERRLQILSNRLDSTRIERLATVDLRGLVSKETVVLRRWECIAGNLVRTTELKM